MGQGPSSDQQQSSSDPPSSRVPKKFTDTLTPGMPLEEKKMLYEKEIARLLATPAPGQEKFRVEAKGSERTEIEKDQMASSYKEVTFEGQQLLYDVNKDGQNQRAFKKAARSKGDVWRKHGALVQLHRTGGKAYRGQPGPKNQFYDVKPESKAPADPTVKELRSVDDYRPFGGLGPGTGP